MLRTSVVFRAADSVTNSDEQCFLKVVILFLLHRSDYFMSPVFGEEVHVENLSCLF